MRTDVTLKDSQLTPELLAQLRQWNSQAAEQGLTMAQYALRWVLSHEEVTSVIVGVSRLQQLKDNLAALTAGKGA